MIICFGSCRRQPHWHAGETTSRTLQARNRGRRGKSECLYEVSDYVLMPMPMPIMELDAKRPENRRRGEERKEEKEPRPSLSLIQMN